jgi:hypothetical protein
MEHYVTLFDSSFLPQGLALHRSMIRHAGNFTLWILCVDDIAYSVLSRLALDKVRLLMLSDVETDELRSVKPGRSRGEYCWTLTPFAPRFVFEAEPTVRRVTYLDADLWFRRSPAPIFQELDAAGKHVLITDHAYAPEYDQSEEYGQYCVQFMTFVRNHGEVVRKWWEQRCIEWCFAKIENGKFGDQKYLDDWPERFPKDVHVLQHQEWTLAPWNSIRFPYSGAIFHHFHGLRLVDDENFVLADYYAVPPKVFKYVYIPYLTDLKSGCVLLNSVGHKMIKQHETVRHKGFKRFMQIICGFLAYRWRYAPKQVYKW